MCIKFFAVKVLTQTLVRKTRWLGIITVFISPLPLIAQEDPSANQTQEPFKDIVTNSSSRRLELNKQIDKIIAIEAQGGAYSRELTEALLELANIQFARSDHEEGVKTLEKGLHIARANNGLFTTEQNPLIEALILHYFEDRNWREVDNWLNEYYRIQSMSLPNNHSDWRKIFYLMAQWSVYKFYNGIHIPTEANKSTYTAAGPQYWLTRSEIYLSQTGGDNKELLRIYRLRKQLFFARLAESPVVKRLDISGWSDVPSSDTDFAVYAINDTVSSQGSEGVVALHDSSERRRILDQQEERIFSTSDRKHFSRSYREGLNFFKEWFEDTKNNPEASVNMRSEACLNLADWHLKFNKRIEARRAYNDCYQTLLRAGLPRDDIDEMMNGDDLNVLSTFGNLAFTNAGMENMPYLQTSFTIEKTGKISKLKIERAEDENLKNFADYLKSNARLIRFRPTLLDGEPIKTSGHNYRVYFRSATSIQQ